jgi:hypothetical protein
LEVRIVTLWRNERCSDAVSELDRFLCSAPPLEEAREALAYRGETHARLGDLDAAKRDLGRAKSLAPDGSYGLYTLDLRLGGLHEETESWADARKHYVTALRTVLEGVDLSGGTALACLLRLSKCCALSDEEVRLAEKVIEKSWAVLDLPGEPELRDLGRASTILQERQGRRVGL